MLDAVRRYIRRIILLHFVLLGLIVIVMLLAAREVYSSARDQAIEQEGQRLQLLADQTARGVESHYLGIMQDLALIMRDESDPSATQSARVLSRSTPIPTEPPPEPSSRPGPGPGGPGGGPGGPGGPGQGPGGNRPIADRIRLRFDPRSFDLGSTIPVTPQNAAIMYRQLRNRVHSLFILDKKEDFTAMAFPTASMAADREIVEQHKAWLESVTDKPEVSDFISQGDGYGYHLVAMPATGLPAPGSRDRDGPRQLLVVAVVPIEQVKERFLDPVNQRGKSVNAALVDQTGRILAAMQPELVGHNLFTEVPSASAEQTRTIIDGTDRGAFIVPALKTSGGMKLPERIIASEQIAGLPGRHWTILFFTPLADTEAVVQKIFRSVMIWAFALSASVAGVLVSTSTILIRNRVKVERMRHELLTRELEQARQIQLAWLPDAAKSPAGLEVAAANLPASHISGDFYNWFPIGADEATSTKTALVIGDVTGHGMAAAFLMSTAQVLVRASLRHSMDPGRCLRDVNRHLCQQSFGGQFVTMGVLIVDSNGGTVEVGSAGHMAPLVARDGGPFEELPAESSLVLGVDSNEQYATQGFILGGGATIALYTDGVVEAENEAGKQFGVRRLLEALNAVPDAAPQARIDSVMSAVRQFCGTNELHDDVTLVIVRVC